MGHHTIMASKSAEVEQVKFMLCEGSIYPRNNARRSINTEKRACITGFHFRVLSPFVMKRKFFVGELIL